VNQWPRHENQKKPDKNVTGPDGGAYVFDKRSRIYKPKSANIKKGNDYQDGVVKTSYFRYVIVWRDWWVFTVTTIISLATFWVIVIYTIAARQQVDSSQSANYNFMKSSRDASNSVGKQLAQMTSQAIAAGVSAKAAKSAAETANRSLHISERAYVTTGPPTLNLDTKTVSVPIVNSGHIPSGNAHIVAHEATIPAIPGISTINLPIEQHWQQWHQISIPTGPTPYSFNTTVPKVDVKSFSDGRQQIVVAGFLSYFDGFPNTREQTWQFCFVALYFESLKRMDFTPCDPVLYIKQLSAGDGYPKNETK
jgi:hypothetical protein